MQEHKAALDTHVVIPGDRWEDLEGIKAAIKTRLLREFDIEHSTLEFDRQEAARNHEPILS